MKANQLATLVLRLLAIYCLIQIVPTIGALSSLIIVLQAANHSDGSAVSDFVPTIIPLVFWLVTSILLFVRSAQWGEGLTRDIGETNIPAVSFEQVQVLAFAVIGALIFANGVSQFFGDVYSAFISLKHFDRNQYPIGPQYLDWRLILMFVGVLLKMTLGLWMFFGAWGFVNFWRSFRNFATPKPPTN
jgi:hypothetical protein